MRILFISGGVKPDYQCDMLLHGLRSLFGDDVVDAERIWFMYAHEFADQPERRARLYGRGFTIFGQLSPDAGVDRTDIEAKIRRRFFNLIVFGSIHRCRTHLDLVREHYRPHEIVMVDGEDRMFQLARDVFGVGIYMKRELPANAPGLLPIQFAIPEEKIATYRVAKTRAMAICDPRDRATYIYHDEAAYYGGYGEALFGVTMKKGGWDCLRHYEIMANHCVPYMIGLDDWPRTVMTRMPYEPIARLNRLYDEHGADHFATAEGLAAWEDGVAAMMRSLREHLTTAALARYVVDCHLRAGLGLPMDAGPDMSDKRNSIPIAKSATQMGARPEMSAGRDVPAPGPVMSDSAPQASALAPLITQSDADPADPLAKRIIAALRAANNVPPDPAPPFLAIEGMSGRRYRLLINALIRSLPDARYLEVGVWAGSTFCSAIAGNRVRALAVDNFSQFGGPKQKFYANLADAVGRNTVVSVIEADFRSVDFSAFGPFNVYLFDGPHERQDQYDAMRLPLDALDERFIMIVDDWNHPPVRDGTEAAILDLGLSVEYRIEVRTSLDGSQPRLRGTASDWHNGYLIAVLRKPPAGA